MFAGTVSLSLSLARALSRSLARSLALWHVPASEVAALMLPDFLHLRRVHPVAQQRSRALGCPLASARHTRDPHHFLAGARPSDRRALHQLCTGILCCFDCQAAIEQRPSRRADARERPPPPAACTARHTRAAPAAPQRARPSQPRPREIQIEASRVQCSPPGVLGTVPCRPSRDSSDSCTRTKVERQGGSD